MAPIRRPGTARSGSAAPRPGLSMHSRRDGRPGLAPMRSPPPACFPGRSFGTPARPGQDSPEIVAARHRPRTGGEHEPAAVPTRISHQCHGLRGAVGQAGKERRAERCGASGKRLDAPCQPDSAALRVAPRRPTATSRASTVGSATLFGPLLADRAPGRDAGRDTGENSGLNAGDCLVPPCCAINSIAIGRGSKDGDD